MSTESQSTAEAVSRPQAAARPFQNLGIIIPTWKAERHWADLERALAMQGLSPEQVLIIDSSSPDRTCELARASGYRVVVIPQKEFGHGRTRQAAIASMPPEAELLLYMTQDAVLDSPDSVCNLCAAMNDPEVGAAYGRQLPRAEADAIERHARLFSYPDVSQVRSFESRHAVGIRAAFLSNSFAIYRRTALEAVGGFPSDVIFGEDSYVAAKLLMAGWKVVYQADATAVHSHAFTVRQEFARYFDIGVHHDREAWMLEAFGSAGGEGQKFVRSELAYLNRHDRSLIPLALVRTATKLLAYRLGRHWRRLPNAWNCRLSSNPVFWQAS
ncbi:glycosyltransferase family 2 protein [Silvibacterium dinghuense]|uniref:Glycosyltransferase family 2 protein n=1 Tax=Silvibacterium dinghuense TaxID=1560006 RepID=A0A4Q1SJZ0_9BACT|nr:glycosyltransferase [Silvibacterium dinghuense]RXS97763.1 glycosyltransferase family 2 protein [Silvibacterium dinghuense]GGH01833.1 rhamnosyltransferase [Silvibacterium dinghuense]